MKQQLLNALRFLRLIDEDSVLSITYIAVWVVLVKIALTPEPSIAEMGGLLVTLALYYGKKHINRNKIKATQEQADQIAKIQAKLETMADKVGAVATTLGFSKK